MVSIENVSDYNLGIVHRVVLRLGDDDAEKFVPIEVIGTRMVKGLGIGMWIDVDAQVTSAKIRNLGSSLTDYRLCVIAHRVRYVPMIGYELERLLE